jgi:signal peptidase II
LTSSGTVAGEPPGGDGPVGDERALRRRRAATVAATSVLALAADQVTKSIALAHLHNRPVHVIGPFSLSLAYNTGIAFSIGIGLTIPIVLIAVVVVGCLIWFARSTPALPAAVAAGLVLGGALGNLADRFFRGHGGGVVDFIASTFWPTFNVADACVTCGCILFALSLLRAPHPATRHPAAPDSS